VAGQSALGNVDAERTIVRVKRKLEGVSASEGEGRGVEGQVQELLQQAMASDRLCRLYVGWAPFL
jgi:serine-protein kinase ATM